MERFRIRNRLCRPRDRRGRSAVEYEIPLRVLAMKRLPGSGYSLSETVLFSLFAAATVAGSYHLLDLPLAALCRSLNQQVISFFEFVTILGEATWPLTAAALLGLLAHFLWKRKEWVRWSLFVFTAVAASGLVTDLIKWVAGRWRPKAHVTDQFYGFDFFGVGYEQTSFPSGHATTIWAFSLALAVLFPRSRFLWYAVAILVTMSRFVIGAHYLSDTLAGFYVAVITVILLSRLPYFQLPARPGKPD